MGGDVRADIIPKFHLVYVKRNSNLESALPPGNRTQSERAWLRTISLSSKPSGPDSRLAITWLASEPAGNGYKSQTKRDDGACLAVKLSTGAGHFL